MVWAQVHGPFATTELLEVAKLKFTLAPFALQKTKTHLTYNRMLLEKKKMLGIRLVP